MAEPALRPNKEGESAWREDLLGQYLNEIARHPLLTAGEEVKLARAIEEGEEAAERLEASKRLGVEARKELEEKARAGRSARQRSFNPTSDSLSRSRGATLRRSSPCWI
ncbi:MAG: sigma-70 factor domain-containing protein [Actinomycetota bacterium]